MNQKEIDKMHEGIKKRREARKLKFPLTVNELKFDIDIGVKSKGVLSRQKPGDMVQIRSCREEHGDKTRLGVLIGFVPIHGGASFDKETGTLTFELKGDNPAIFIPELNEVVLGCESWWGEIENEKQLRQITNEDIGNVWYVKALKAMSEASEKKKEA